jgi:uncharacterized protein (DUF58 family)
MQIRRTFWGVFILLVGAIIGAVLTRSGVYYRLIYFSILLIVLSWLWARLSITNVELKRVSRGLRQQLGQIFEEQFTISNHFPLSKAWIEVEDGSGLLSSGSTRVLSSIKPNVIRNYSGYTLLSKRGEYFLSPTILYSGDPFGLFVFRKTTISNERLLVLPYLYDVQKFPLSSGRLPGGIAVRQRTPEVQPPRAASVREYSAGDSLNRIHWPTTARRDRLMVKEFEQDPQADIWILLDAQEDVNIRAEENGHDHDLEQIPLWWLNRTSYKLPLDTFEYSVSVAGSIARYFSRNGQVVGFACTTKQRLILSSERGERQLNKILETLALVKPEGRMPIESLVDSQAAFLPRGSTVILITPSVKESLVAGAASLIQRGLYPIFVLIDPSSFGKYYGAVSVSQSLKKWNVPTIIIRADQDVKKVIEEGAAYAL